MGGEIDYSRNALLSVGVMDDISERPQRKDCLSSHHGRTVLRGVRCARSRDRQTNPQVSARTPWVRHLWRRNDLRSALPTEQPVGSTGSRPPLSPERQPWVADLLPAIISNFRFERPSETILSKGVGP